VPLPSAENAAKFGLPDSGWTLLGGIVRPKSRGHIRLTGLNPLDPVQIEANYLSHPDDLKAAVALVELCREIGNSAALHPFTKRELMPGNLKGAALENFIRDAVKGRGVLQSNAIRTTDGSNMPWVTAGNTMTPCVVIGGRREEMLKRTV
jgi:choline dehydrogenase